MAIGDRAGFLDDLLQDRVVDLIDEDGRPLGEGDAAQPTATTFVPCPYRDRRHGRPMNVTALHGVIAAWPAVLARLRGWVGAATVHEAWRACVAAVCLPLIGPRPVPRDVAAGYKACLGYGQVLTFLLLEADGVADRPLAAMGSGEDLLTWLDSDDWLAGSEQVCPGPPAMIVEGLQVLATPTDLDRRDWDPRFELACTHWALQVGLVCATYQRRRRRLGEGALGTQLLDQGSEPFLHAVTRDPRRRPEHVRRLFPECAIPAAVEAWLAADERHTDAAFHAAVARA